MKLTLAKRCQVKLQASWPNLPTLLRILAILQTATSSGSTLMTLLLGHVPTLLYDHSFSPLSLFWLPSFFYFPLLSAPPLLTNMRADHAPQPKGQSRSLLWYPQIVYVVVVSSSPLPLALSLVATPSLLLLLSSLTSERNQHRHKPEVHYFFQGSTAMGL